MKVERVNEGYPAAGWLIFCPACNSHHLFSDKWRFNGNEERPSFAPSMIVRIGPMPTVPVGRPDAGKIRVCHFVLTDGKMQFQADCTHSFVGQTVPLPELP